MDVIDIDILRQKYRDDIATIKDTMQQNPNMLLNKYNDYDIAIQFDKAYKAICNYEHWTEFDNNYISSVYSLTKSYLLDDDYKNQKLAGKIITQKSEGSRSITYSNSKIEFDSFGLTADVKATLPTPKLRCF